MADLSKTCSKGYPPRGRGEPKVTPSTTAEVPAGSVGYNAVMGTANANGVSMKPGSVRAAISKQLNKNKIG